MSGARTVSRRGLPIALGLLVWVLGPGGAAPAAQTGPADAQAGLPPLSWTCPMHPDVIEGEAGSCPICQMDLVPTRLDLAWTCTLHSVIAEKEAGRCPICGRELVRITVALSWTCPMHPEIAELQPGACPICAMDLVPKTSQRPHGDHNARYGGLFFMAPDNWHHLEGEYPLPGVFRVHLYDDYTRPLSPAGVEGRAVTREEFDPATRETRELETFPLTVSADGEYLEAMVGQVPLPARITAKLRFGPDQPEHRFDFAFTEYTTPPAASPVTRTSSAPGPGPSGAPPDSTDGLLTALLSRSVRLAQLVQQGTLNEIYVPALEAKDFALALDDRLAEIPESRRRDVGFAIKRLVRAAWLLDGYGDLGNRRLVDTTYAMFEAALNEIKDAFAR